MFNFLKENTNAVAKTAKTRKAAVLPNIAVQAQNRVKFSPEALELINHTEGNYIYVATMPGSGIVLASLNAEAAKEHGMGYPLNKDTTHFTNSGISDLLGGNKSEWKVETSEPVHHDEDCTLWAITETVNGKEKLAEIEANKEEVVDQEENSFDDVEEASEEVPSSPVYETSNEFA